MSAVPSVNSSSSGNQATFWGHVYQLRLGTLNHCANRGDVVGRNWVVNHESYSLGRCVIFAVRADDHTLCPRSLDLS